MRVFISGTSADLAPFRRAVDDVLRQIQAEPVEQKHFGVDYAQLPSLLENKIKDCDAVVCLLGSVFGAAPPGSTRSYTQMEYDFATRWQKPTFLFFFTPAAEWKVDPSVDRDTAEQRQLQSKYVDDLRSTTKIYYQFQENNDLREKVLLAFVKISPEAAAASVARTINADFPSVLSGLYNDNFRKEDSNALRRLAGEALRFTCLLALHDSVVHRVFGLQSADRRDRLQALAQARVPAADWRLLLRLACANESDRNAARFIAEFAGWEGRNSGVLDRIVRCEEQLSDPYYPQLQAMIDLRQGLSSLFAELGFLRRYILLVVTGTTPASRTYRARILRGLEPSSFEFTTDEQSALQPEENHLYLLRVDRRRALRLAPVMTYRRPEMGDERVYGWFSLQRSPNTDDPSPPGFLTKLWPFEAMGGISASESADGVCGWLGQELCQDVFGFGAPGTPGMIWDDALLDKDSWNKIHEAVFPSGELTVVGERFRRPNAPVYRGLHADLFEVKDVDSGEGRIAHVLRPDSAADEEIRAWFIEREECWREIADPRVVALDESSDAAGKKDGVPFLIAKCVPRCRNLEQVLQSGQPLPDRLVVQAIEVAAHVCRLARERNIYLLALPPRHFLMDDHEHLLVTGFEAATKATPGDELLSPLLRRLSRCTKDLDAVAPELRRESGTFGPALDVFALGRLIAQLRRLPAEAMNVPPDSLWDDPWRCLTYHCLAADPNSRFLSTDQALEFALELSRAKEPQTIAIHPTSGEPGFRIGKYPVTNQEYYRFTRESGWRPPLHLRPKAQEDAGARRLSGPWLPVTYVSLEDAQEYCEWLTRLTSKAWRLPAESEWMRAAAFPNNGSYPWGDDNPNPNLANYGGHYRGPTVVGAFPAKATDATCREMGGNVWEWCTDIVKNGAPRRIVKGGAYDYSADTLRLASNDARIVTCRSPHIGFRIVCEEIQ